MVDIEMCVGCLSRTCDFCPRDDGNKCRFCPCDDCQINEDGSGPSNYYDSYTVTYTTK